MTVAVIVAAYQARADWLQQCLASIDASAASAPGLAVHVRIGVDGCAETARLLDDAGRSYSWTSENVGAYILRNSLIRLAAADAYVIFDADDVMLPTYLSIVTRKLKGYALVGPSRHECDAALTPTRFFPYRHGVCAFRHEVLARLGGYQAERLGADVDFIARARSARIQPHITTEACYLRRRHAASLTKAADTGFGSVAREQARKRMERQRLGGTVYVKPVTVPLEARAVTSQRHIPRSHTPRSHTTVGRRMSRDELLEYGRMVKVLDQAVRRTPDALWPLCIPATRILHEVEETRYTCPMCKSVVNSHRCDCPVTGARRGLRTRTRRVACR